MKIKICIFIIFALIFSTILPSFALASPLETTTELQETGEYQTAEVEQALEEVGFKDVEVREENNIRSMNYVDEKGIEYTATYNLENEEYTFDSSDSSLSPTEKEEITEMAPIVVKDTNTLYTPESSEEFLNDVLLATESSGGLPTDVVVSEGSSWTYQGTTYGNTNNRDAVIAAVATYIVLSLPAGVAVFAQVKALFGGLMLYIGWTRTVTYLKAVIYTKHDAYTLQTRVHYYTYYDKARTKLKSSEVRYHTVQKTALR